VPEEFSIPDLLSLLQVDNRNAAIKMAMESERLCRRHRYEEAITAAQNAVHISGHKSELQGIALLYLSAARFLTAMPDECEKSIRDCTRAIRVLSTHTHNRAIAQIVRAKYEIESDGTRNKVSAVEHLDIAAKMLQGLITDSHEYQRGDRAKLYQDLLEFVESKAGQLHSSLTEIDLADRMPSTQQTPSTSVSDKQEEVIEPIQSQEIPSPQAASQSQQDKIESKLPIPTRLLWPTPSPTRVELFPPGIGTALDYIDASRLSVDGQPYFLEPIAPVSDSEKSVRLYAGKQYLAYQVEGSPNQRVLVRNQDRPDQRQQFVVVADPVESRVWIDNAESDPLFTNIHILGIRRTWSEKPDIEVEPHIIGVVEAIMTKANSD
jgi:hypothetical protein